MNNATQIVEPNNTDDRSLASRYPQLSLQWHPILNGTLIPNDVTATNHRRVWWQYEKGHAWMAPVYSHVTGCGCPVCANKMILTKYSVLATKTLSCHGIQQRMETSPLKLLVIDMTRKYSGAVP